MKLYLVQHGQAMAKELNPDRPLTDNGKSDVEKVARFLNNTGIKVAKIIHSGKPRAEQTAGILASALNPKGGIIQKQGITPNDSIEGMRKELLEAEEDLMIVGHLPYLGKLTSTLVTGSESSNVVSFQQGGAVCLERKEDKTWQIVFMVTPSLLV